MAGTPYLYTQLGRYEWYYNPKKWEHDVALKDLSRHQRVLEIGCGRGEFILRARKEKHIEIEGLEQNMDAIEIARRQGLTVSREDIHEIAQRLSGQYDVICSFQVLEHVSSPLAFLESCAALLPRGGRLILGLPNEGSFLKYEHEPLEMPPHHLTKWSVDVLEFLPRILPFRVERVRFEPLATYHVDAYFRAYSSRIGVSAMASYLRGTQFQKFFRLIVGRFGARRFLRGHTVYARLIRV